MKLIKDLLLVQVTEVPGENVLLTFLDEEEGNIYEVRWNFREYDREGNKWVPSDDQVAKVEEWSQEYFDVPTEELKNLGDKGIRKDVYHYEKFNSLWEVSQIARMSLDRVGDLIQAEIVDAEHDFKGYSLFFEEDGETYRIGGFGTTKYLESLGKSFPDPSKEAKMTEKFEEYFGVTPKYMKALVGETVMVEVKKVGKDNTWIEPKKMNKNQQETVILKAQQMENEDDLPF